MKNYEFDFEKNVKVTEFWQVTHGKILADDEKIPGEILEEIFEKNFKKSEKKF